MATYKHDKTRLLNILKDYRDYMITKYHKKLPHIPITQCIEDMDKAIKLIKFCI